MNNVTGSLVGGVSYPPQMSDVSQLQQQSFQPVTGDVQQYFNTNNPVVEQQVVCYQSIQGEKVYGESDNKQPPATLLDILLGKLRGYQQEVFDQARDRNTIVVMPTGTGKTMIALATAESVRVQTQKPVVLLFHTNALCKLQYEKHLSLINDASGRTQYISRDHAEVLLRDDIIKNFDYVFTIDAHFVTALESGNLSISTFSFVVYDEVHNVVGRSKGVNIMDLFYCRADPDTRPQIMGLTATPVRKVRDLEGELTKLCDTMHAVVCFIHYSKKKMILPNLIFPPPGFCD